MDSVVRTVLLVVFLTFGVIPFIMWNNDIKHFNRPRMQIKDPCKRVPIECRQWYHEQNDTPTATIQFTTSDTNLVSANMTLPDVYKKYVYDKWLAMPEKARFVGFKADGTGIGNNARAFFYVFSLAIVTDRILFIDSPMFSRYYRAPEGVEWEPAALKTLFPGFNAAHKHVLMDRPPYTCALGYGNLSELLEPYPIVAHAAGSSAGNIFLHLNEELMSALPQYRQRKHVRDAKIVNWLLSNKTEGHRRLVEAGMSSLGLSDHNVTIAVGTRTFYDWGRKNREFLGQQKFYWEAVTSAVKSIMESESLLVNTTTIFYTTDDPQLLHSVAVEHLREFGHVVTHPVPVLHTARTKQLSPAMLDHHIVSVAKFAVISRTTFHMSARLLGGGVGPGRTTVVVNVEPNKVYRMPLSRENIICEDFDSMPCIIAHCRSPYLMDIHF